MQIKPVQLEYPRLNIELNLDSPFYTWQSTAMIQSVLCFPGRKLTQRWTAEMEQKEAEKRLAYFLWQLTAYPLEHSQPLKDLFCLNMNKLRKLPGLPELQKEVSNRMERAYLSGKLLLMKMRLFQFDKSYSSVNKSTYAVAFEEKRDAIHVKKCWSEYMRSSPLACAVQLLGESTLPFLCPTRLANLAILSGLIFDVCYRELSLTEFWYFPPDIRQQCMDAPLANKIAVGVSQTELRFPPVDQETLEHIDAVEADQRRKRKS